jgi:hypothetical protein
MRVYCRIKPTDNNEKSVNIPKSGINSTKYLVNKYLD